MWDGGVNKCTMYSVQCNVYIVYSSTVHFVL